MSMSGRETGENRVISIVLPVYNEIDCLPSVVHELYSYLSEMETRYQWKLLFVDDCSDDGSFEYLDKAAADAPQNVQLTVVQLAKNSGSHIAITAGLRLAQGEYTIIMASDGQDPNSVIEKLLNKWEAGYQIVLASRFRNRDQNFFSAVSSKLAWRIMNWATEIDMPAGGCDMLGMDKKVLRAFNRLDERNTTFIYRILSLGFRRTVFTYEKKARIAGRSKWNMLKKCSIMLDAITGYSSRPLRIITKIGFGTFLLLILRWMAVVFKIYVLHEYPSEMDIILNTIFTSLALQMLILGGIGDYIWRILDETRKRPLFEINMIGGSKELAANEGESK